MYLLEHAMTYFFHKVANGPNILKVVGCVWQKDNNNFVLFSKGAEFVSWVGIVTIQNEKTIATGYILLRCDRYKVAF